MSPQLQNFKLLFWLLAGLLTTAYAGEKAERADNPEVREIKPGLLQIEDIRVDLKSREISFPAEVNMTNGIIEYALVHANGKVHESLLRTEVQPAKIHLAFLLLGLEIPSKPAASNSLAGLQLSVQVSQTNSDSVKTFFPRLFIQHSKTGKWLTDPKWIYNGSLMEKGLFAAQETGSIMALMTDRFALINSALPEAEDDSSWQISTNFSWQKGTPVMVQLKLK